MTALTARLRRAARYAWYTTLTFVGLGALAGSLGSQWWPTAIFIHFALQFCWIAGLLTLAALLRRRWRSAAVAALLSLWQLWILWPQAAPATGSETVATLKVISLNTWYRNTQYDGMIRYLRASDADVIGLVEVTPRLKAALAGLHDLYPYQADCIDTVPLCEEVLLSRRPLRNIAAGRLEGSRPVALSAQIDLPGGPVDFLVTHLSSPLVGLLSNHGDQSQFSAEPQESPQAEQAARLTRHLTTLGPDAILMGDFNAAPWSPILQELRLAGGWHPNHNLAPSWPRWLSAPLRLPIDHILARGRAEVVAFDTGPALASDHLPVVADIVLHRETKAP